MRLFVIWCASIALSLASHGPAWSASSGAEQSSAQGSDRGEAAYQKWGATDAIKNLFVNALTGGSGSHETLSGNRSFSAAVSCPSSARFLSVSILPYGTGDIRLFVRQDSDLDGADDYLYEAPFQVSGVCADGVVACDPGTWNNCLFYKWTSTTGVSRMASLQATSLSGLSGCYCINNSCGAVLALTQIQPILSTLGAGAAAAIQGDDPKFVISDTSIEDTTISYSGQSAAGGCVAGGEVGASTTQTAYLDDGDRLSADGQNAVSGGGGNADAQGRYNSLHDLANKATGVSSSRMCSIVNTAVLNVLSEAPAYDWLPWLNVLVRCWWGRDSINGCDTQAFDGAAWYNTIDVDRDGDGVYDPPADYKSWGSGWSALSVWESASIDVYGRNLADECVAQVLTTYGGPADFAAQEGTETWQAFDGGKTGMTEDRSYYSVKYSRKYRRPCTSGFTYVDSSDLCYRDQVVESTADGCSALDSSGCQVMDEKVDGVTTMQNGLFTGLVPLPSSVSLTGQLGVYTLTKDWWRKDRVYACPETTAPYSFGAAEARINNIASTVNMSGSTFSYGDKGTTHTHDLTLTLPDESSGENCEKACKLSKASQNTGLNSAGQTADDVQVSNATTTILYKQCATGVCPVSAGETILTDCQCLNDFAEAAALMQAMGEAIKDVICSGESN